MKLPFIFPETFATDVKVPAVSKKSMNNNVNTIEAIPAVNAAFRSKSNKYVIGGGELTKDEQIKIKNLNLEIDSFLNLNGDDEILFQLYSNARVLIYPSKAEGFGLPIIEAFSSGCPVVCSNIPVLKEVADNAAVYFDPNDTDSIKENLNKVLYSDSLRQSLIVKGTERVKSFTWNRCAEETLKVYKKL